MPNGTHFFSALQGVTLEEASPLAKSLKVDHASQPAGYLQDSFKSELWSDLSYSGAYGIAYLLRGFEGVDYPEILRDVCEKMDVPGFEAGDSETSVLANEKGLIEKIFTDLWGKMSDQEKVELLKGMDLPSGDIRLGGTAALAAIYAASMGGFATYQITVVVANLIARALLGEGLAFGTNIILTRALSFALGPIGWIAGGAWLARDLDGPAYRKTVPAVLQVAALRQLVLNRDVIGIVGNGSVGKDSLIEATFGIQTGNVSAIPGSTRGTEVYPFPGNSQVRVVNFPGFQDPDASIRKVTQELMSNCHLLIFMVDSERYVLNDQIQLLQEVRNIQGRAGKGHLEVVFNRLDRVEEDITSIDQVVAWNKEKLGLTEEPVRLSLKRRGDIKHPLFDPGVEELRGRINRWRTQVQKRSAIEFSAR